MSEDISIDRLRKCLEISARIVVLHGLHYTPIFERLEQELKQAEQKQEAYNRAVALLRQRNI